MARYNWFLFDVGNVLVKLAYERVLRAICAEAMVDRDRLVELVEKPGGYRDLERGEVSFEEFYGFLIERAGYRGSLQDLRAIWSDFFDGPIEGMEEVVERVRMQYQVAFLTNSNSVHEEVLPRQFPLFFRKGDCIVFSHRYRCAKPDTRLFERALELMDAVPSEVIFVDDLLENVIAARNLGIRSFHFSSAVRLVSELEEQGLLASQSG